MTLPNILYF